MAPAAVPAHSAKVASTALDHPAVVATTTPAATTKKRKLDSATSDQDDAGSGAEGGQERGANGSEATPAALSKLDKGKAKKRRKEEQRALVSALTCQQPRERM